MLERVQRVVPPARIMPLLGWYGRLAQEPELRRLRRWIEPGRTALDVGANRGVWTWHMVRLGARVHAFEPNPALAAWLRAAVPAAAVHAVALSDAEGEVELRIPVVEGVGRHAQATVEADNLFRDRACERVETVRVPRRPLDAFGLEDVRFVKIDVEGHELAVLRGARETLARCRPVILYEAEERHRPGTVEGCRAFLAELDYEVRRSESANMWLAVPRREGRGGGSLTRS